MRRLMLLIAASSLWLFLAAVPVLADGGPHVASVNNGTTSLTADSCAGCHRAHTAQGAMLLNQPSEEELCLSCHGAAGTGATTSVMTGVQYALGANGLRDTSATIGALRGGGFDQARIGDPFRYTIANPSTGNPTRLGKVQVAAVAADVTSAHIPMAENGLIQPGRAWGNGANGSGAGPTAHVECASCHNPHGNGQYRILNKIPSTAGVNPTWVINLFDYGVVAPNVFRSVSSMGVLNGDTVSIIGNTNTNFPATVSGAVTMVDGPDSGTTPDDNLFTLAGISAAGSGTGGWACRGTWNTGVTPAVCVPSGTIVTDAALPPAGDARNYTVIQTVYTAPTLLASQAAAFDPTDGDYFHYRVPWNGTSGTNYDAPNAIPGGTTAMPVFAGGFGEQMAAWCASCHTRYWAWQEPTEDTSDGAATGPAYSNPRPGDSIFKYQHRTRGASGRGCLTCHVSHGSNAVMDGPFSSTFTFPDGTASDNSRLLKVGNRGTCQQCHDPTGTSAIGDQYPPAPYPVPDVP